MAENAASQITGDDIIAELIRNVDVGVFKVRYTVLVPCRFNVYLHEQDFDLIRPVADVVRREAKQALAEHLASLNKARVQPQFIKRLGLAGGNKPEYRILEKDWVVEFHRSEEERLRPGEIEIYSDLGTDQAAELGAGAKTTFITRQRADEPTVRTSREAPAVDHQQYATLRYSDAQGEKCFALTRDEIVIGRGGKAVWVDLKLDGPPDISREHCRIRRDAATGRFFIKDLSQYGTAVNGSMIPSSVARNEHGDKVDRNVEFPLPPDAKIALADVLVIAFEAPQPG